MPRRGCWAGTQACRFSTVQNFRCARRTPRRTFGRSSHPPSFHLRGVFQRPTPFPHLIHLRHSGSLATFHHKPNCQCNHDPKNRCHRYFTCVDIQAHALPFPALTCPALVHHRTPKEQHERPFTSVLSMNSLTETSTRPTGCQPSRVLLSKRVTRPVRMPLPYHTLL